MLEIKQYEHGFINESLEFYDTIVNESISENKTVKRIKDLVEKIFKFFKKIYRMFKEFVVNLYKKLMGIEKVEAKYEAKIEKMQKEKVVTKKDLEQKYSNELFTNKIDVKAAKNKTSVSSLKKERKEEIENVTKKYKKDKINVFDSSYSQDKEVQELKKDLVSAKLEKVNERISRVEEELKGFKLKDSSSLSLKENGEVGLIKEYILLGEIIERYPRVKRWFTYDKVNSDKKVGIGLKGFEKDIAEYKDIKSKRKETPAIELINDTNARSYRLTTLISIDELNSSFKKIAAELDKDYKETEKEITQVKSDINALKERDQDTSSFEKYLKAIQKKISYINFINRELSTIVPEMSQEKIKYLKAVDLGIQLEVLKIERWTLDRDFK